MNPVLNERFLPTEHTEELFSISGAIHKTLILGLLLLISAGFSYAHASTDFIMIGAIGGFICALVIIFSNKKNCKFLAPIYSLLEGLFLGSISVLFANSYGSGLVFQAILLTISVLFCMLIIYQSGIIKVTNKFRLGVFAATGGICLLYFFSFIFSLFGAQVSIIHGNGLISIGFSIFVVIIAAMNLILDFDFIKRMDGKVPKYMEWYAGFGLMVTLVWLYLEILRLLTKIQSRR